MSTSQVTAVVSLHWAAVAAYVASLLLFSAFVGFGRARAGRAGTSCAAAGLVLHSAGLLVRWIASGHGPYIARSEVLSSYAWVVVAGLLVFLLRRPRWGVLSLVALPAAILMVGAAMFMSPEIRDLPPALRSVWLVFHVLFVKLAAAAFLLSVASAVILLLGGARRTPGGWLERVPDGDALDAYILRFIGFGLLFWTVSISAGSIWANQAWGRYWGWDPIETWSLVTWLAYGMVIHLRLLYRVRGRWMAWAALGCFSVAVLTIFLLPFLIPTVHAGYFR